MLSDRNESLQKAARKLLSSRCAHTNAEHLRQRLKTKILSITSTATKKEGNQLIIIQQYTEQFQNWS